MKRDGIPVDANLCPVVPIVQRAHRETELPTYDAPRMFEDDAPPAPPMPKPDRANIVGFLLTFALFGLGLTVGYYLSSIAGWAR